MLFYVAVKYIYRLICLVITKLALDFVQGVLLLNTVLTGIVFHSFFDNCNDIMKDVIVAFCGMVQFVCVVKRLLLASPLLQHVSNF